MQPQSGFGSKTVHRLPTYDYVQVGRVTSVANYKDYGRLDVVFHDYSQPHPVWVTGHADREPVEGDQVLVGFINGRPDQPYLISFVRNESYTSNFLVIQKDKIRVQLPVFDIGVANGVAHKDVKEHLLNDGKLNQRAYVELTPNYALIHMPTSSDGSSSPATIKLQKDGQVILNGGGSSVARVGDTVSVYVPGVGNCTGTITSGSGNLKN